MSKADHDTQVASMRARQAHYDRPWYDSVARVLESRNLRGLACLDLCAGHGEFAEILRDRFGMRVTCADYAEPHLARQRELGFETLKVDLDAQEAEVDAQARAQAGRFDLVVTLATIEHVFDSDNFLRFCHTVLKPGGWLVVNTPNIGFLGYRLYSMLMGGRPFGDGHHVRFWDYRFLRTNLFLNGFGVVQDARGFYGLPTDPLTRALRGRSFWGRVLAWPFHLCRFTRFLPGGRNWSCDELTVLAQREDVPPVGFALFRAQQALDRLRGQPEAAVVRERFAEALRRGWLGEHLMLSNWVRELTRPSK